LQLQLKERRGNNILILSIPRNILFNWVHHSAVQQSREEKEKGEERRNKKNYKDRQKEGRIMK